MHPKFVKASKWRVFPHAVTERRGITSKKKNEIVTVLKGVPLEKKEFWKNIYTNEKVSDLATSRDAGENEMEE